MHDYDNFRYIGTQKIIELSNKENDLLRILIDNKGKTINNEKIILNLSEGNYSLKALRQLISRLRKKLKGEITIKTKNNMGYGIK